MAAREPTRAQLSSKLSYQQNVPAFLQKLQNRINGIPDEDEDEDEEFEYVGGGRAPIPKRPAIPERPKDDPGSADEEEDFVDERPQVVVLKAGKHLTEREVENVKRKEKGLPPLPEEGASLETPPDSKGNSSNATDSKTSTKSGQQGLSFSSSSKPNPKSNNKRKAIDDLKAAVAEKSKDNSSKNTSKKPKKSNKTLLSFGDDT